MAWRGIHISKPAGLTLRHRQLVVSQGDEEVSVPLEDIAYLILDTPQTTLTGALLAGLLAEGVVILQSDSKHIPCGLAFPFHGHWRQGEIAHIQIDVSQPFKKRVWQRIVRQKILNQAAVLAVAKTEKSEATAKALSQMAPRVRSGDPDNLEAQAARNYWPALFSDFRRGDDEDRRNGALNYGYAVIRACLARTLVASGLIPAFGIHHASVTNALNLADDLIEPFRPFVDFLAVNETGSVRGDGTALSKEDRQAMAQAPLETARLCDAEMSLLLATERVAQSLVSAMRAGDPALLELPEFVVAPKFL